MTDKIQFECSCGASLEAPASAGGHRGRCRHCGNQVDIPVLGIIVETDAYETILCQPNENESDVDFKSKPSPSTNKEVHQLTVERFCNICQSPIHPADSTMNCDECDLPFHVECWEENLGCSAYGCASVNKLRKGPDIRITHPSSIPPPVFAQDSAAVHITGGMIPLDYVLLAISTLAVLFSFVCFGLSSLAVGVGTLLYFLLSSSRRPSLPLVACMVLCAIGFPVGVIVSYLIWF